MAPSEYLHATQAVEAHLGFSPNVPLVLQNGNQTPEASYHNGIEHGFCNNVSLMGCAPRTFLMYHPKSNRVVLLKDSRRVDPALDEHICKGTHEKKVPHIAALNHATDVTPMATPISRKPSQPHRHYRSVLGVGRPVMSFTSSWELISAMRDAIEGIFATW
jgi:hypothetical protein